MPLQDGQWREGGDFMLDGVAFPGAQIQLEFLDPGAGEGDAGGGPLFPTGQVAEALDVPGLGRIEATLINGVRHPGAAATRTSMMPAFGRDGILTGSQISQITDHVLSLTGQGAGSAEGAALFATNCAICHGADGAGLRQFGAPSLNDAVWLYGDTSVAIRNQINAPQHGVMPAWGERLDPATIRMLAAYVHSLGGGEDFVEVAAQPAVMETNEQP